LSSLQRPPPTPDLKKQDSADGPSLSRKGKRKLKTVLVEAEQKPEPSLIDDFYLAPKEEAKKEEMPDFEKNLKRKTELREREKQTMSQGKPQFNASVHDFPSFEPSTASQKKQP
jgi:hypothetical protein